MKRYNKVAQLVFTFGSLLSATALLSVQFDKELLTHYREGKPIHIEHILDKQLTQDNYWSDYLKDVNTTFGYFESYDNILICDKNTSSLILYKKIDNNYKKVQSYSAFTGKIKGDKTQEGDLKTPLGVYRLTRKIDDVDSFYGPMAFVTSYPNLYDKYQGKTGKGIWIHGLPLHQERDQYTKGCIAIDNKGLVCLDENINIDKTLLLINRSQPKKDLPISIYTTLFQELYRWRYAWIYNDLQTYLNFYDDSFIRFDGMNKAQFSRYKKRIFKKKEKKKIVFKNINIIPYPDEKDTYEITFEEFYRSSSFAFHGKKTLIVKLLNNTMHIITEQ